jgi:bifunctional NMN adenylyltransferase/nudix hydrolase
MSIPAHRDRYDLAVFVGRFQPFHNGHLHVVREALAVADRLLLVVGSAGAARRPDLVPFTGEERREMIMASLTEAERGRVLFALAPDYSDLGLWTRAVEAQALAAVAGQAGARTTLIGCAKDRSSYYLRAFPQWDAIAVAPHLDALSATPLRAAYFDADSESVDAFLKGPAREQLPGAVVDWLDAFRDTAAYADLVEEWAFARRYRATWSAAPYPPTFVTADAVVFRAGHVLLIRRKGWPGRGLWALPGGFVEQDEFVLDAAVRELAEETALNLDPAVLRASLEATQVYDAPLRDIRGRVISHAAFFHLPGEAGAAPHVEAADDAEAARWTPLAEVRRETMFGDHFQIIRAFATLLGEPGWEER